MAQQENAQKSEILEMIKNDEEMSQQIEDNTGTDSEQPSYCWGILYLIHPECGNPYWVTPVRLAMPQFVNHEKENASQPPQLQNLQLGTQQSHVPEETPLENPRSMNQQVLESQSQPQNPSQEPHLGTQQSVPQDDQHVPESQNSLETEFEKPQLMNQQLGEGNRVVQNGEEESKGSNLPKAWFLDPSNRWILHLACSAAVSRYVLSYIRVPMRFGFSQHWVFALCVCLMALFYTFYLQEMLLGRLRKLALINQTGKNI